MNKTVFFVILLFAVVTLNAQDITGSWEGSLEVQNRALRLVFHIERNDTILTTKMDSPDQGAFGLPTTRTTFKENRVEIVATGLGLYYNGTLENDTLKGTFNQGGIPFPLLLMRTEGPLFSRPQTPLTPLPYISEAITIIPDKNESLSLAGTLTLPDRTVLRDKLSLLWEQLPLLLKLKVEKEPYLRNQFNAMITTGYRSFLAIDPAIYIEKVSCPVYAINGENDTQVPAEKNLTAIKRALQKGRNYRGETKSYPGLNHIFQESITGEMNEYANLEQTISPEVLSDILNWMRRQVE